MDAKSKLETVDEVINAAGGTSKVAVQFGVSVEAVCAWRKNGLPSNRYLQWQEVLFKLGKSAPPSLWGQK